jgi:PHP family Zn ribbon phosphoesterase
VLGQSPNTKRVQGEYQHITDELGSELHILAEAKLADLEKAAGEVLAQAILQVRTEDIYVEPGYDGVFGKISLSPSGSALTMEPGEG